MFPCLYNGNNLQAGYPEVSMVEPDMNWFNAFVADALVSIAGCQEKHENHMENL